MIAKTTTTTLITPAQNAQLTAQNASQSWFVYLVQTAKGLLYTGISTNPARRLRQHQGELAGGAKALRGKGPLTLVWQYQAPSRSVASVWEYQLKQLTKAEKNRLVSKGWLPDFLAITAVPSAQVAKPAATEPKPITDSA